MKELFSLLLFVQLDSSRVAPPNSVVQHIKGVANDVNS